MRAKWMTSSTGVALLLLASSTLVAHHGTNASYQLDKMITLDGVVTEFAFAYPHVQLYFDVKDARGNVEHWASELPGTPVMLKSYNVGWSKTAIKPGDQIVLTCHPAKSEGAKVCLGEKLIVNGKELPTGRNLGRGDGEKNQ